MIQGALGLIEVIGLVPALEAADTCLKSSNVQFIGYEKVTPGLVTVKIQGDVGAVKAAIEAAKVRTEKIGTVVSTLVIPRPATGIDSIISSFETTFKNEPVKNIKEETSDITPLQITDSSLIQEVVDEGKEYDPTVEKEVALSSSQVDRHEVKEAERQIVELSEPCMGSCAGDSEQVDESVNHQEMKEDAFSCNLCSDPVCPREKGQPKYQCIHYKENKITMG